MANPNEKMSEQELAELCSGVRGELGRMIKSEWGALQTEWGLRKAAGDQEDEPPPAAEGSGETPGETSASPGEAPGEASGGPQGGAPGGAPPDPAAGAGGDPGAGGMGPPSLEELTEEYSQLPPQDLELHYQAVKNALMAAGAGGGPAGAGGGEMSPGGPGAGPEVAAKFEGALKALEQRLGVKLETLVKSQLASVPRPQRRAVTEARQLPGFTPRGGAQPPAQPAALNKSDAEIRQILRQKARTNLSKSDRELISGYCQGEVDATGVAHLLK